MPTRRSVEALYGFFEPGQPARSITPDRVQDVIATALVSDRVHVVRSLDDLPEAESGEIVLPADKVVLLVDNINLGSTALRLSAGTVLRGLSGVTLTSSAEGGVIRATDLAGPVILREFNVVATAGPAIVASGGAEHQFNAFVLGLFGASAGQITGFDVASFKDCFVQAADGITFGGTTSKTFVSQCPFYGITSGNAAITFAADYEANRADIVNCWWKGIAGAAIRAVEGYQLDYGRISNGMMENVDTPLSGLTVADLNWWISNTDGLDNSRAVADARLESAATTTITTQGEWTTLAGTRVLGTSSERFGIGDAGGLEYLGRDPVRVSVSIVVSCDPPASTQWQFAVEKNGVIETSSIVTIEQGGGTAARPRSESVVDVLRLETGDTINVAARNQTNTANLPVDNVSYAVSD